jgi:hypothetical protein
LENTQDERYGVQPEYQAYIRTVPVLFPFIPVYSLKKGSGFWGMKCDIGVKNKFRE